MAYSIGTLYFGDNYEILKEHIKDESVDLIYLDPPFNSNATYNRLFKSKNDEDSPSQIQAFNDTWEWGKASADYYKKLVNYGDDVSAMIRGLRSIIGTNDMMAYIVMMTVRMIQLHRVLKPTGTLYLHCDTTASHYLKLMMDCVFGTKNFRNEIVWNRVRGMSAISKNFRKAHDCLLRYTKTDKYVFHNQHKKKTLDYEKQFNLDDNDGKGRYTSAKLIGPGKVKNGETGKPWRGIDPNKFGKSGSHWIKKHAELDRLDNEGLVLWPDNPSSAPRVKWYLDESKGIKVSDVWTDISAIESKSKEAMGYDTQKPEALLERIIEASSNEGDVVLDPFCGCGTAMHVAHKLKRHWIGIDVTHLAIELIESRMMSAFGIKPAVIGVPTTLESALELASRDKFQFEVWAVTRIEGIKPNQKKGRDRGIDGRGVRVIGRDKKGLPIVKDVIVSVKGGQQIGPAMIRDLKGTVKREGAGFGVFVCIKEPTPEMKKEVASGDMIEASLDRSYPQFQIYTIKDYFEGRKPDLPPAHRDD